MTHFNFKSLTLVAGLGISGFLVGCSNTPTLPPPTPLPKMSQTDELQRQWQLLMGQTLDSDAVGLNIAIDDTVQPAHLYSAATAGWLTAIKAAPQDRWTDQVIWQKKLNEVITAGPVIQGESLLFGTNKGSLYALDKQTGALRWQAFLSSEVMAPPVMAEGKLFTRTVDGKLYALDAKTGQQIWVIEHEMPNLSLRGAAPVTVANGVVFVGWETGVVEALSAASGQQLWQQRVLTPHGRTDLERMVDLQTQLKLQNGRLLVFGYHGKLVALNPQSGLPYWVKSVSGYRNPVVDDVAVYVVTDQDQVQAYDLQTGALRWQQTQLDHRRLGNPHWGQLHGRKELWVGDGYGRIERLDPLDGTLLGYFTHEQGTAIVKLKPAGVQPPHLYVQDEAGYLTRYAIQPTDLEQFRQRFKDTKTQ